MHRTKNCWSKINDSSYSECCFGWLCGCPDLSFKLCHVPSWRLLHRLMLLNGSLYFLEASLFPCFKEYSIIRWRFLAFCVTIFIENQNSFLCYVLSQKTLYHTEFWFSIFGFTCIISIHFIFLSFLSFPILLLMFFFYMFMFVPRIYYAGFLW